jgi:hypothetical protein
VCDYRRPLTILAIANCGARIEISQGCELSATCADSGENKGHTEEAYISGHIAYCPLPL